MNTTISPFHLAIPVWNLEACRQFYINQLGCTEGRSTSQWVDLNLFGHQLVLHYKPKTDESSYNNEVDGKQVPIPHFGVVLPPHFVTNDDINHHVVPYHVVPLNLMGAREGGE